MVFSPCAQQAIDYSSGGTCDDLLMQIAKLREGSVMTAWQVARISPDQVRRRVKELAKRVKHSDYPSVQDIADKALAFAEDRGYSQAVTVDLVAALLDTEGTAAEQALTELGLSASMLRRIRRDIEATTLT